MRPKSKRQLKDAEIRLRTVCGILSTMHVMSKLFGMKELTYLLYRVELEADRAMDTIRQVLEGEKQ